MYISILFGFLVAFFVICHYITVKFTFKYKMSQPSTTKMKWSGTNKDLLNLFTGHVDKDVIEEVIFHYKNDLSQAYDYLNDIVSISNPQQNVHLSSNEEKNEVAAVVDFECLNRERLSKNKSPTDSVIYLVSKGYKVMVLMRGCPGSGKSYQAINILNRCYKNADVDEFIFSTDKFFTNKNTGRFHFKRSKLTVAHQWAYENAQKAVEREVTPVIVDNTNTQAWEMENYVKLGVNNGYWIEIIEPSSEWAWDAMELLKKNTHTVPYDTITLMLSRYDHNIDVDSLLTKLKLKYNKKNQPPLLSNCFKNYQLNDNIDKNVAKDIPTDGYLLVNDSFKNMHISQKHENSNDKQKQYIISNNSDENPWVLNTLQDKEFSKTIDFNDGISDVNEESKFMSSSGEASNYVNKSVNTYENDFLFMGVLNELPEEEYNKFVIYGKNRDINEKNTKVLNISCGRLDKSTTTSDLKVVLYKPNLNELRKLFSEDACLLITELFEKCEGNMDWIVDMLVESGYDVSKQQLLSLFESKENHFDETISNTKDTIDELKLDNNLLISSPNSLPNAETLIGNEILVETQKTKKDKKFLVAKAKKLSVMDSNLRKDIESKFTFGDSLYSEHVLKIKKIKDNQNMLNFDNVVSSPQIENASKGDLEKGNEAKFVQLVVDPAILVQLCDYFGDFSSDISKSTLPMSVKLPEKLAEDLYYCLIANVPTDIFDQETILKDEMLARELQEGFKEECVSNIVNPCISEFSFASVLSKKLLLEKFKHLDPKLVLKVMAANNYKYQKASDVLSEVSGDRCLTNQENLDTVIDNEKSCVNENKYDKLNSNQNYRQEALEHAHMRQQYLNKANQSLSTKIHSSVTGYYLEKAEESKQNEKYANIKAIVEEIKRNENVTTMDLHFLPVQDALLVLDLYLDSHILKLKKYTSEYSRGKQLTIITGRGLHSPNGISRIKPAVLQRLQVRRLMYLEPETPGLLLVIIKKNSILSSDL